MTSNDQRRYLIAYDVPDDRRRSRLASQLQRFGDRIQYSVFALDIKPSKIEALKSRIEPLIDTSCDSVLICDLGPVEDAISRRFSFLGRSRQVTDHASFVV